jgi:hypothetical protein
MVLVNNRHPTPVNSARVFIVRLLRPPLFEISILQIRLRRRRLRRRPHRGLVRHRTRLIRI